MKCDINSSPFCSILLFLCLKPSKLTLLYNHHMALLIPDIFIYLKRQNFLSCCFHLMGSNHINMCSHLVLKPFDHWLFVKKSKVLKALKTAASSDGRHVTRCPGNGPALQHQQQQHQPRSRARGIVKDTREEVRPGGGGGVQWSLLATHRHPPPPLLTHTHAHTHAPIHDQLTEKKRLRTQ